MNPVNDVATSFVDMATQLMNTLSDAWPSEFQPLTNVKDKKALLASFVATYGHLFAKASAKDITIFDDPVFNSYKPREKLSQIDVNILWQYIVPMVKFATMHDLYKGIPNNIMDVISGTVQDIKSQIDSGTLDMKTLNPFELGQSVMAKMNPDEVMRMTQSLLGNEQQMEQMMKSMQVLLSGSMGASMPLGGPNGGLQGPQGLPGLEALGPLLNGSDGAPDLSSLFKLLQDKK